MAKLIHKIIEELVDSLDYKFDALTSVIEDDSYRLTACYTYWLTLGYKITINIGGTDYDYTIKEIELNESILLEPCISGNPQPGTGEIFDIPKPTYRHGTARAINEELTQVSQNDKRLFFWLYEVQEETFFDDPNLMLERDSPVRMFLFAESDIENWNTDEHYTYVICPLAQLFDKLREKIKESSLFNEDYQPFRYIYLPNWGEFNAMKGFSTKIFDEQWSGIECRTTLKIDRSYDCVC